MMDAWTPITHWQAPTTLINRSSNDAPYCRVIWDRDHNSRLHSLQPASSATDHKTIDGSRLHIDSW